MESSLPKPWPKAKRLCSFSKKTIERGEIFYSFLLEGEDHFAREDVLQEHFDDYRSHEKRNIVAWWMVSPKVEQEKQPSGLKNQMIHIMKKLLENWHEKTNSSFAKGLKAHKGLEDQLVSLALVLERKKLAKLDFERGAVKIEIFELEESLILQGFSSDRLKRINARCKKLLEALSFKG